MHRERGRLLRSHSILKLVEDVDDPVGASKPVEYVQQKYFVDHAEGFGEINKGHKQILVFFPAVRLFFLKLSGCENHFD